MAILTPQLIKKTFRLIAYREALGAKEYPEELTRTLDIVIKTLPKSRKKRSQSSYPAEWILHEPTWRAAVKNFLVDTIDYRNSFTPREQPLTHLHYARELSMYQSVWHPPPISFAVTTPMVCSVVEWFH